MKKIAIFHCGFIYTGGGERIVLEEIKGLEKRGYDVDCYVPNYDSSLSYPDIIGDFKIKTLVPQLPSWVPLRFAVQMVLSCLLMPFLSFRFKDYDGFLGANQPGAYFAWVTSKILKKPYWVYLNQPNRVLYPRHNEDWQNVKDYLILNKLIDWWFKRPVAWLDKKSIVEGEQIFINGSFVAQEIVEIYQLKSWVNCPGGAKAADKKVLQNDRFKGKVKANGCLIKKPYVLYTSRHEPWKKFDWAIEIMKMTIDKFEDVRLVIPGAETSVTPALKKLASDLGIKDQVIFTGPISQKSLWRLYGQAAVYIFTSPEEDLGIVVEEAQAHGVPVVAWNRGGPTVTVNNGETGYLVEPYNLNKMAGRILELLEKRDKRDRMGRAAWQHIRKNFSWEKHVEILEKELNKKL